MTMTKAFFNIPANTCSRRSLLILMALAFIFAFTIRLYWVYLAAQNPSFVYNGEVMINTNDGYFYAEGAADILGLSKPTLNSPTDRPLSIITAFLYKITPLSLEALILYTPAFFGSLIVIPLLLLGRELGNLEVGFIAALLGSIAHSYYNRTMAGYFDTDMLILLIALFAIYFAIKTIKEDGVINILGLALIIIFGLWYYPNLKFVFIGIAFIYTLLGVIKKKTKDTFFLISLNIILLSILVHEWYIKLILLSFLFGLLLFRPTKSKLLISLLALTGIFLLALITYRFLTDFIGKDYVTRSMHESDGALHYFSVMNTIKETAKIDFNHFAHRISGNTVIFFASVIGTLMLFIYDRRYLLLLPLLVLGYFAFRGGLRFTIYAVPVQALGFAFLSVYLTTLIRRYLSSKIDISPNITFYSLLSLLTGAALYPNITHILEYKVPTVFSANEVNALVELKELSSTKDFGVSWWDYGYPIRYYADINTFIDGGTHSGADNYPISLAFSTDSEQLATTISKMYANYLVSQSNQNSTQNDNFLEHEMEMNGFNNPNDFLDAMKSGKITSSYSGDIFFILPYRMAAILPTVYMFSHINLLTGETSSPGFYLFSERVHDLGDRVALGNGVFINKKEASLILPGGRMLPIKRFVTVGNESVNNITLHPNAMLSLIYMKLFGSILVMNEEIYNSLFIKLFFLQSYDKRFFEPVVMTPYIKIYKVKNDVSK